MPGTVPPVADEREGLLAYLAQMRNAFDVVSFGLTEEQVRLSPSVSVLTIGGLVKHVTSVESYWIDLVQGTVTGGKQEYEDNFRVNPDDTIASLLNAYHDCAQNTETVIGSIADLGQPVPVPRDAPWYPDDVEAWSVRWVLLHLIQETARHAGHADIVRESIDGATLYPLMAAAEGWPASDWLQPWTPAS
jgi:uncharacterized damage-inducible protein DinB